MPGRAERRYDVGRATGPSAVRIDSDGQQQRQNVDGVGLDGCVQSVLENPRHDGRLDVGRVVN